MNLTKLLGKLQKRQNTSTDVGETDSGERVLFKRGDLQCDGSLSELREKIHDETAGFGVPFVVSDSEVDRDNDRVMAKGLNLENFLAAKAPVLFAHNQRDLPVARAPDTQRVGNRIKSTAQFPSADLYEFGNTVGRLVLNDFLGAASIGFLPTEWKFIDSRGDWAVDFLKADLLEYSIVPVPANPRALVGAKSMGIELRSVVEWCEKTLDEGGAIVVPRSAVEEARKAAEGDRVVLSVGGWDITKSAPEQNESAAVEADEAAAEDAPSVAGDADEAPAAAETAEEPAAEEKAAEADDIPDEAEVAFTANDLIKGMRDLAETVERLSERLGDIETETKSTESADVAEAGPAEEIADGGLDALVGLPRNEVERIVDDMIANRRKAANIEHQRKTGELPEF